MHIHIIRRPLYSLDNVRLICLPSIRGKFRMGNRRVSLEELGTGLVIVHVWIAPICPA